MNQATLAGPGDWRVVAEVLGSAFVEDPVFAWLMPGDSQRRSARLRRYFAIEARDIALAHEESWTVSRDGSVVGAVLALPPGHWRVPVQTQLRRGPAYLGVLGHRLVRAVRLLSALERRHPREAHMYVAYVGVLAQTRGLGLGSALLEPVLARADRAGLPVYLEASSPDNARLYRRLGFRDLEQVRPGGSPPIQLMRRATSGCP